MWLQIATFLMALASTWCKAILSQELWLRTLRLLVKTIVLMRFFQNN